jgi:hypothetical protein
VLRVADVLHLSAAAAAAAASGWRGLQGEGQTLCLLNNSNFRVLLLLLLPQVGVGYKVNGKTLSSSMPASIEDLEAAEVRVAGLGFGFWGGC